MVQNTLTLTTPLNHKRSESQKSPESVDQATKELPKKLTLYIPENFDIDEILQKSPPDFKFHKDCFVYIIHLINDIPSRNKDADMDFVPLYSSLLQLRIRDYRKYLDYLVTHGVLIENKQYIKNKQSKSFKLTPIYNTKIKPTYITKRTLIKSILKFIYLEQKVDSDIDLNDVNAENYNIEIPFHLKKWFNEKLTIDFKRATEYLQNLFEIEKEELGAEKAQSKFNRRYVILLKLNRGEYSCSIDRTAGRFHTNLTQLKGELRQFLKYDEKTLVAIDITNSQPYISTMLLNLEKMEKSNLFQIITNINPNLKPYSIQTTLPYYVSKKSKNIEEYMRLVKSGKIYEEFGQMLVEKGLIIPNKDISIRKQAKVIFFKTIFSPNNAIGYSEEIKLFKDFFPDVYEIFKNIKYKKHNSFACLLQKIEADIVLHKICYYLYVKHPDIPIFTLHDSIITTDGNEQIVHDAMLSILSEEIGTAPVLKLERWEEVA